MGDRSRSALCAGLDPSTHPGEQSCRSGANRPAFGRYLADHISGAKHTELPGADTFPLQAGDFDQVLAEVEQFLSGAEPTPMVDRVLGTHTWRLFQVTNVP